MLKINRSFFSPQRFLIFSMLSWGLAWLTSPVEYHTKQVPKAVIIFFLYIVAFYWGCSLMVKKKPAGEQPLERPDWPKVPRNFKMAFTVLLIMGLTGLFLRFFDLLVVKSYLSASSGADFRNQQAAVDATVEAKGPLGVISAFLYPLSLVVFVCAIIYRKHLLRWQFMTAALGMIPFVIYSVLISARSPLFSAVIMSTIAYFLSKQKRGLRIRLLSSKFLWTLGLISVFISAFFGYSIYIIQSRLASVGFTPSDAMILFEKLRDVEIKEPYRQPAITDGPVSSLYQTGISLSYYYVHGFYEFQELYAFSENHKIVYGRAQFHFVARLFGTPATKSNEDDDDLYPQAGLFYTFFGNVLVDWGIGGGIVYCIILGMFTQYTWNRALAGRIFFLLLYPLLGSVIFHFPIADMIAGGAGTFYLIGICTAGFCFAIFDKLHLNGNSAPNALPEPSPA